MKRSNTGRATGLFTWQAMQDANGGLRKRIKISMHKPRNHHKNPGMHDAHGERDWVSEDALGESVRTR
jgi:hypothetical protein